jgi:hypothetical protein
VSDRSTPGAFLGDWRITTMELWAKDAIELLGPGLFTFEDEAFGEFRFIAVRGWMDCRGWGIIEDDGTLSGRIYFHQGDDSAFTAMRTTGRQRAARRPRSGLRKL